jgi:uncharacterized membrane protein
MIVMAVVGLVAGGVSGAFGVWAYAPLIGWDAAAATFSLWVWLAVTTMGAAQTEAHAKRQDPSLASTDVLALVASLVSLAAVGLVLTQAINAQGGTKAALAGLAAASVALSWFLVHTLFTLRYARLYYAAGGSGIDFNQEEPPRYVDFAYVAFTIGMTFQVSDTDLRTTEIRGAALRQALLAYLFGAVILATTVNFIVSLSSS